MGNLAYGTLFFSLICLSSVARAKSIGCEWKTDQPGPPVDVSMGVDDAGDTFSGWLNYNDHPHAAFACTRFFATLKEYHKATCAGVYDMEFDSSGEVVYPHDVVVLEFTDTNGKLQVSFNPPVGTPSTWPAPEKLDCVYE